MDSGAPQNNLSEEIIKDLSDPARNRKGNTIAGGSHCLTMGLLKGVPIY